MACFALAALLAAPGWWLYTGLSGSAHEAVAAGPPSGPRARLAGRGSLWMVGGTVLFLGGGAVFTCVGVWTLVTAGRKSPR